jgi:hypothetical protein
MRRERRKGGWHKRMFIGTTNSMRASWCHRASWCYRTSWCHRASWCRICHSTLLSIWSSTSSWSFLSTHKLSLFQWTWVSPIATPYFPCSFYVPMSQINFFFLRQITYWLDSHTLSVKKERFWDSNPNHFIKCPCNYRLTNWAGLTGPKQIY